MSIADVRAGLLARIREAVESSGLSQGEVARRAGTHQPVIQKYLRPGVTVWPSGQILSQLPEVLHVSGHWLLTGQGPRTPPDMAADAVYEQGRAAGWHEAVESLRGLHAMLSATAGAGVELSPEILDVARRVLEAASNPKADQRPEQPPGDAETG